MSTVTALAVAAILCTLSMAALAANETSLQWGANRTSSPWSICVYDGANLCQPVFTLPPSGGGPQLVPGMAASNIGNLGSGHVFGNGSSSPALGSDTPLISIIQQSGSGVGSGVATAIANTVNSANGILQLDNSGRLPAGMAATNGAVPHVANLTSLQSYSTSYGNRVHRDGYATAGDGGGSDYTYSSSACSLNAGAGDGGYQVEANGSGCWIADLSPTGRLPLALYGPVNDGTTDNLAKFNAAVTAAALTTNATLILPVGSYAINGTVSISSGAVHLVGQGVSTTEIVLKSLTANGFQFIGSAFDPSIEQIRIVGQGNSATNGCAIEQGNGTGDVRIVKVRIENVFNAICMSNSGISGVLSIDKVDMADIGNDCIQINGGSQFFMSNTTCFTSVEMGLHIVNLGGFYVVNSTLQANSSGVYINPGTGQSVFDGYMDNVEIDDAQGAAGGVDLDSSGGGSIYLINMNNVRSGFGASNGFAFNGSNTSNITLTNWMSVKNVKAGVDVENLQDSILTGGKIIGNSATGGSFDAVDFKNGSGITFSDSVVNYTYPGIGNSNQPYGINIFNTYAGGLNIHNVDMSEGAGVTANLVNSSTSAKITIENNPGYNPVGLVLPALPASGTAFTNGSSPATVILSGGTCSALTVGGAAIPNQCSSASFPLAPGQQFVATYSVTPNFYLLVQ